LATEKACVLTEVVTHIDAEVSFGRILVREFGCARAMHLIHFNMDLHTRYVR